MPLLNVKTQFHPKFNNCNPIIYGKVKGLAAAAFGIIEKVHFIRH